MQFYALYNLKVPLHILPVAHRTLFVNGLVLLVTDSCLAHQWAHQIQFRTRGLASSYCHISGDIKLLTKASNRRPRAHGPSRSSRPATETPPATDHCQTPPANASAAGAGSGRVSRSVVPRGQLSKPPCTRHGLCRARRHSGISPRCCARSPGTWEQGCCRSRTEYAGGWSGKPATAPDVDCRARAASAISADVPSLYPARSSLMAAKLNQHAPFANLWSQQPRAPPPGAD